MKTRSFPLIRKIEFFFDDGSAASFQSGRPLSADSRRAARSGRSRFSHRFLTAAPLFCLLLACSSAARSQTIPFPTTIPNLLARWEPSVPGGAYADTGKTKPATTDGAPVAVIADLSGNGYDMVQAAGADQGAYKTSGSFKPACVRFNGTSSAYSAGSPAAFNALASGGYTVFFLFETLTGQGLYGTVLSKQSGGHGPFSFMTLSGTQFARYNTVLGTGVFTPVNTFPLNTPSFLTYQFAPLNLNTVTGAPPAIFGTELLRNDGQTVYDVAQEGDQWVPTSNVRLGSNDTPGFYMKGDLAAVIVYARALQAVEIAQVESYLSRRYNVPLSKGPGATPVLPLSRVILSATGNSLMSGYQTESNSEFRQATEQLSWQPVAVYNEAIGGQNTPEMTLAAPEREDKFVVPGLVNALFAWEGANEINSGATGETAYMDMAAYLTDRHAAGFKPTFAFTLLPRGTSASFETQRQSFNHLLKSDFTRAVSGYPGIYAANSGVTYADYLVDIGSDPTIGVPSAQFQTTYYTADATHLTAYGAGYAATKYFAPAFNLVYNTELGAVGP